MSWVDVYVPVKVTIEIDGGGKPTGTLGQIEVDYDGAPWAGTGSEDDVYNLDTDEWMPHSETEGLADVAVNRLQNVLTTGGGRVS